MANVVETMPIDRDHITTLYYHWWLEVCKLINPSERESLRRAVCIIEAYRSDLAYLQLLNIYRKSCKSENFCRIRWEKDGLEALQRYMDQDKKRILKLAVNCPNMLICIAGVINGIRRSSNIEGAIKTILLLDVIDRSNIKFISKLETRHLRFLQKSHSVYLPLKEPEIFSVVSLVENLFKIHPAIKESIDVNYLKSNHLISRTLGLTPNYQVAV